jgi:hypothetical protein
LIFDILMESRFRKIEASPVSAFRVTDTTYDFLGVRASNLSPKDPMYVTDHRGRNPFFKSASPPQRSRSALLALASASHSESASGRCCHTGHWSSPGESTDVLLPSFPPKEFAMPVYHIRRPSDETEPFLPENKFQREFEVDTAPHLSAPVSALSLAIARLVFQMWRAGNPSNRFPTH